MKGAPLKQLTITTEKAARVLTDLEAVRRLEPFMKRDITLSEAAKDLKVKLPSLLYHVNKFLALGLIEVVREIPRKGRAIRVYRSTSEQFFVPFHLTPSETLGRMLFDLSAAGEARFHRETARALQTNTPIWGLYLTCGHDDRMEIVLAPSDRGYTQNYSDAFFGPSTPAVFSGDGEVRLDFRTAKAFQKDLVDLFKRYRQQDTEKEQLYAYRLGLTPLHDESFSP